MYEFFNQNLNDLYDSSDQYLKIVIMDEELNKINPVFCQKDILTSAGQKTKFEIWNIPAKQLTPNGNKEGKSILGIIEWRAAHVCLIPFEGTQSSLNKAASMLENAKNRLRDNTQYILIKTDKLDIFLLNKKIIGSEKIFSLPYFELDIHGSEKATQNQMAKEMVETISNLMFSDRDVSPLPCLGDSINPITELFIQNLLNGSKQFSANDIGYKLAENSAWNQLVFSIPKIGQFIENLGTSNAHRLCQKIDTLTQLLKLGTQENNFFALCDFFNKDENIKAICSQGEGKQPEDLIYLEARVKQHFENIKELINFNPDARYASTLRKFCVT